MWDSTRARAALQFDLRLNGTEVSQLDPSVCIRYPPKAVLGAAYEFAEGQRLASGDFEGGKTGAVRVLGNLGFSIEKSYRQPGQADTSLLLRPRPNQVQSKLNLS